jgi:hypothetical protein
MKTFIYGNLYYYDLKNRDQLVYICNLHIRIFNGYSLHYTMTYRVMQF